MAGLKEVDVAEAECKQKAPQALRSGDGRDRKRLSRPEGFVATPGQIISERASAQRG